MFCHEAHRKCHVSPALSSSPACEGEPAPDRVPGAAAGGPFLSRQGPARLPGRRPSPDLSRERERRFRVSARIPHAVPPSHFVPLRSVRPPPRRTRRTMQMAALTPPRRTRRTMQMAALTPPRRTRRTMQMAALTPPRRTRRTLQMAALTPPRRTRRTMQMAALTPPRRTRRTLQMAALTPPRRTRRTLQMAALTPPPPACPASGTLFRAYRVRARAPVRAGAVRAPDCACAREPRRRAHVSRPFRWNFFAPARSSPADAASIAPY